MSLRLVLATTLLVCCTPPLAPLALPEGCQPLLGGADCFLPYPSDFFRAEDSAQVTGYRIVVPAAAKVKTNSGGVADPHQTFAADGFSTVNPIVTYLPVDVTDEGFVKLADDPALSLSASTSHTLIVDPSGTPVAHFVDLDPRATDVKRRAMILHVLVPLADQTRYSVFVFGVKSGGALAPTPEGFRRVRDGLAGTDPALKAQVTGWGERLKPLAKQLNLDVSTLQLAWEFSTGSQQNAAGDMLRVRALTQSWLETHLPEVTVTSVEENPYDNVWRVVRGTVSTPLFTNIAGPGARLNRGSDGLVAQNGTTTFAFIAVVPSAVRDTTGVAGTFLYGHGFFGNFGELTGGSARAFAQKLGRTMIAAEWWGMSTPDVAGLAEALVGHPSNTAAFAERVHQGFANWAVLSYAVEHVLPSLDAFQRPGGAGPYLQADASLYLGISQGTMLGVGMMAVNPSIKRISFEVGGSDYSALMFRSQPFKRFLDLLEQDLTDPLDEQKFVASLQRQIDRVDPNTYARYLLREPLPGSPARKVVLQVGLADLEVPNFGSFLLARSLGLKVFVPAPKAVWGLEPMTDGASGALEVYDFGIDADAVYRDAAFSTVTNSVHDTVRTLGATYRQTAKLFDEGVLQRFCSGVCDPE